eukprot:Gb_02662 [translate_table: standard]
MAEDKRAAAGATVIGGSEKVVASGDGQKPVRMGNVGFQTLGEKDALICCILQLQVEKLPWICYLAPKIGNSYFSQACGMSELPCATHQHYFLLWLSILVDQACLAVEFHLEALNLLRFTEPFTFRGSSGYVETLISVVLEGLQTPFQASGSFWTLTRFRTIRRGRRTRVGTLLLILFGPTAFILFLLQWIYSIPPPKFGLQTPPSCRDGKGYILDDSAICTDSCGYLCFPRVRGICFGHSQVTVCNKQPTNPAIPHEMRFHMEKPRKKIPVRYGYCLGWDPKAKSPLEYGCHERGSCNRNQARWIRGLQMVADLTLMPHGRTRPNPHHESEKVIPAILLSQLYGLKNSTFFWFADPQDPTSISMWSKGLLRVFASQMKVEYLHATTSDESPICFEDAILFAGLTNAAYLPNESAHDWLRQKVLMHCNIPIMNARRPLSDVVVLHRPNSSRNIANFKDVHAMLERKLHVTVKVAVPGPWEFCQQVRLVAEVDVLLSPHGSQNVAILFARPGAVILEAFPLLYYIDWLANLLHTGGLHHYELYGTWTSEEVGMPFLLRLAQRNAKIIMPQVHRLIPDYILGPIVAKSKAIQAATLESVIILFAMDFLPCQNQSLYGLGRLL